MCLDLFVGLFEKNPELETELLNFPKMRFSKKISKILSAIVFRILILEQNMLGLICRPICRESRTLNRILENY